MAWFTHLLYTHAGESLVSILFSNMNISCRVSAGKYSESVKAYLISNYTHRVNHILCLIIIQGLQLHPLSTHSLTQ